MYYDALCTTTKSINCKSFLSTLILGWGSSTNPEPEPCTVKIFANQDLRKRQVVDEMGPRTLGRVENPNLGSHIILHYILRQYTPYSNTSQYILAQVRNPYLQLMQANFHTISGHTTCEVEVFLLICTPGPSTKHGMVQSRKNMKSPQYLRLFVFGGVTGLSRTFLEWFQSACGGPLRVIDR